MGQKGKNGFSNHNACAGNLERLHIADLVK
jgi:hypothetical protein